ncbi:MAG: VWA domain-containing protein [Bacteroidetes bacterium]|nr:VWA domain-containing protein [Bacteroidota bacterium]
MKPLKIFTLLTIAGFAGILTLSSFYTSCDESNSNPNELLDAEGKQSQKLGGLRYSAAFENDYYTRNSRQGFYYAEVKTENVNRNNEQHVPLNLSVVIDRSGSMSGEKIRNVKQAAKYLVDQLSSEDYLSIVIYDSKVDVLHYAAPVSNKQLLKNKIDEIYDRGGTNLMGGANEGYAQVKRNYRSRYINRVLLLSDGLANEGITDPNQIRNIVRSKNMDDGISISTFGVGRDYNEDLMTAMAENGTGNYYFIDNSADISSIFSKELNGLHDVVAQNAVLKITIPEFVNIEKVYGHTYSQAGRVLTVQFHDVFSEETRGILIKYRVQNGNNTPVRFNSSLSYENDDTYGKRTIALANKSEFTNDESLYNRHMNEWVSTQVALYESNEILESAMKEVDKGNYEEARKIVKKNEDYIKSKPATIQQSREVKDAESVNASYDSKISNIESLSTEDVKFLQKESKSSNYKVRNKK